MAKLRVDKIAAPIVKDEYTGSVFFDGSGDYLKVTGSETVSTGTGDFTIEGWIHKNSEGVNAYFFDCRPSTSAATGNPAIYITGSTVKFYVTSVHIEATMPLDQWVHMALTRESGVYKLWIDGILKGTYSDSTSVNLITSTSPILGTRSSLDDTYSLRGYISNFRICKGHAVYTENFTPPTRELEVHTGAKGVVFPAADNRTVLLACQDAYNPLTEATGRHKITGAGNLGGVPGQELITNGHFSQNTNNWTATDCTLTYSNGQMQITRSGGGGLTANQAFTTIPGKKYNLSGTINSSGSRGDLRVYDGSGTGGSMIVSLFGTNGEITDLRGTFIASSTTSTVVIAIDFNDTSVTVDNISVSAFHPITEANPGLLRKTNVTSTITETTGSVYFDGSGDHLSIANNSDFHFGSEDFTIEGWYYHTSYSDNPGSGLWYESVNRKSWLIYWNTQGQTRFFVSFNGSDSYSALLHNVEQPLNTWIHLACTRQGSNIHMYINGILSATQALSGSTLYTNTVDPITIGQWDGNYDTAGYISNFRVCKGHAVYTSNFTPPTRELEVTPETVLLACYDGENIFAEKTGKIIAAYGDRTSSPTPTATDSPIGSTTVTPGLTREVDPTEGPTFGGGAGFVSQNWLTLPDPLLYLMSPDIKSPKSTPVAVLDIVIYSISLRAPPAMTPLVELLIPAG
jgi:hypothetical protein